MARAITRIKMGQKRREKFLDCLAITGNVMESARAVGFSSTTQLHTLRRENEDFAEKWDLAVDAAVDLMEEEADRRAIQGVMKPVFYKGNICGYEIKYSDALLMFRLKALRSDRYVHQGGMSGGGVNIKFGVAIMPMQAVDEKDWENRAVTMHDNQEIIQIEDKPHENLLQGKSSTEMTRGS